MMHCNRRVFLTSLLVLCISINNLVGVQAVSEDNVSNNISHPKGEDESTEMDNKLFVSSKYNCYYVGDDIEITYSKNLKQRQWIGIYQADNQRSAMKWLWTCDDRNDPHCKHDDSNDNNASSALYGSMSFSYDSENYHSNAVLLPGMYFLYIHRGYYNDNGHEDHASIEGSSSAISLPFRILPLPSRILDENDTLYDEFCGSSGMTKKNSVQVDKSSYVFGVDDAVTLFFDRISPQDSDWVAIYPVPVSSGTGNEMDSVAAELERELEQDGSVTPRHLRWQLPPGSRTSPLPSSVPHGVVQFDISELLLLSSQHQNSRLDGRKSYVEYKAVLGTRETEKDGRHRIVPLIHTEDTFTVIIPQKEGKLIKKKKTSNLRVSV